MYFPISSALIEFIILSVTKKADSYGYEISQSVKLVSDIKESTLYPILKKLVLSGYLTTYSKEFQGRIRKYYSITKEGELRQWELSGQWEIYKNTIDQIVAQNTGQTE